MRTVNFAFALGVIGMLATGCSSQTELANRGHPTFLEKGKDYNVRLVGESNVLQMTVTEVTADGWLEMQWHGPNTETLYLPERLWVNSDQVIWVSEY